MMDLSTIPQVNWVDLIVVTSLIRGGYIGLARGFSVELFKLSGMLATAVISLLCYKELGRFLTAHSFLSIQVANVISFIVIFIVLLIIFKLIRVFLFRVLHLELFGSLEKWGGLSLGLARSFVFASLFLFMLALIPVEYIQKSVEEKSFSGQNIKKIAPYIKEFVMKFKPKA